MNPVGPKGQRDIKIIGYRLFLSANCTSENNSDFFGFLLQACINLLLIGKKYLLQIISILSIDTTAGFYR